MSSTDISTLEEIIEKLEDGKKKDRLCQAIQLLEMKPGDNSLEHIVYNMRSKLTLLEEALELLKANTSDID
jgi:hypothetical protein